jgi:hypothetical protein
MCDGLRLKKCERSLHFIPSMPIPMKRGWGLDVEHSIERYQCREEQLRELGAVEAEPMKMIKHEWSTKRTKNFLSKQLYG